jgi:hypothetical protein
MVNERRVKSRYPIELNVRYQTMGTASPVAGVGQTLNMSSSGMLLACASNIAEGTRMKMFIEWPSLLDGTTPLQLITVGRAVRRTETAISILFESYQFRTMSRARQTQVTQMPARTSSTYSSPDAEPLSLVAKASS